MKYCVTVSLVLALLVVGCVTTTQRPNTEDNEGDRLSVGTVQKEIRKGMSSAEVIEALGSPNLVSTDSEGREVWVYDRIATNTVRSSGVSWIFAIFAGETTASESTSRSQRTLTITIKFDAENRVRDFAYHSSKF